MKNQHFLNSLKVQNVLLIFPKDEKNKGLQNQLKFFKHPVKLFVCLRLFEIVNNASVCTGLDYCLSFLGVWLAKVEKNNSIL